MKWTPNSKGLIVGAKLKLSAVPERSVVKWNCNETDDSLAFKLVVASPLVTLPHRSTTAGVLSYAVGHTSPRTKAEFKAFVNLLTRSRAVMLMTCAFVRHFV